MTRRFDFRELHHALALEAGVPTACPVCAATFTPQPSHIVCASCFERMRRTLTFREMLLGVGCKVLAGQVQAATSPVDPDA